MFAAATGRRPLADPVNELTELGTVAANALARAVARAVFEAKALPGGIPSWRDCHGGDFCTGSPGGLVDFRPELAT